MVRASLERDFQIADPSVVEKILQLYNTMASHKSVLLVGPPQSGKSTCCITVLFYPVAFCFDFTIDNTLRKVLPLSAKMIEGGIPVLSCNEVKTHIIYPHTLSTAELYGEYDTAQQSWTEGLLQNLIKTISLQLYEEITVPSSAIPTTGSNGNINALQTPSSPHPPDSQRDQASDSRLQSVVRHWLVFDGPLQGDWLSPIDCVS